MLTKTNGHLMFSDNAYSAGKKLVQVIIPATSSAYFALGAIWGLPAVDKVTGTLAVVATFLGVCLGLSSNQYDKSDAGVDGKLVVGKNEETGNPLFSLQFDDPPSDADPNKTMFHLKVVRPEGKP